MARRAWDRQPGESLKAYTAFAAYRDIGISRSIDAAWQRYSETDKITPGYIRKWAVTYEWVERTRAYDQYIDAQAQKKAERDAITRKAKMLERHAALGRVLQTKAIEHLQANKIDQPKDAIAAARLGVDLERKSEGLPEYLIEIMNASDVDLTKQYNELLSALGADVQGDEPTEGDS